MVVRFCELRRCDWCVAGTWTTCQAEGRCMWSTFLDGNIGEIEGWDWFCEAHVQKKSPDAHLGATEAV